MKKNIFNIIVPLNSHGYRIDKFLQSQISELSRTRLQALIRGGHVKLNNTVNYSNIVSALILNLVYFVSAVAVFYLAFSGARKKGTLINVGE